MPLTFDFEEEYRASRTISISEQSFQQTFSFFLCGDFYDQAEINPTYGADDDVVALQAAYAITPPVRTMPLYDGGAIVLTLSNLNLEQISYDVWKATVTYAPRSIDQSPGNAGPNVGDRERWSENFVQLSFNVTAQQEQKSQSLRLLDIQKNVGFQDPKTPYVEGAPAPIGHTVDGVEGASVYVRSFSFGITAYFNANRLSFAYVRRLYRLATTLNNKSFFGFPAGSVLFLEATATGDLFSVVPVTFSFEMRPNFKFSESAPTALMDPLVDEEDQMFDTYNEPEFLDSPKFGSPLPGGAFSGWTTVDYRYANVVDSDASMILQKPVLRLVHQNYEFSNFDYLEL